MDIGVWWATVHGVIESDMTEQLMFNINTSWGFPGGAVVKIPPANAGDAALIRGSGRDTILAWKMPWTEEPGQLQAMGSQRVRHD